MILNEVVHNVIQITMNSRMEDKKIMYIYILHFNLAASQFLLLTKLLAAFLLLFNSIIVHNKKGTKRLELNVRTNWEAARLKCRM